jgi:O-antigen ligase
LLSNPWQWVQMGVALFVYSPLLGALSVLMGSAIAGWQHRHQILANHLNQLLIVLSLGLAITASVAINSKDAWLGLFNVLPYFAVFAALSVLLTTPQHLRRLSWILTLTIPLAVLIGWGQQFWGWQGPVHLGLVINWPLQAGGNPPGRMASVFDYTNVFSSYLVVVLMLVLGLFMDALRSQGVTSRRSFKLGLVRVLVQRFQQAVLGTIAVSCGLTLILTNSRNAWAIALLGCLAYAIYLGWTWLWAGVLTIAGVVTTAAFGPYPLKRGLQVIVPAYFWARLTDELYPDRPVAQLRSTQWAFTLDLAIQRPWTGWGLRSFSGLYEAKTDLWLGHPHNLFLMLAAEAGLPITLALVGLVAWILGRGFQSLSQWPNNSSERLLIFSYLVAFLATTLFHTLDVTLFDLRINLLGWLLLSGIYGVSRKPA